jgi:hypothetical protein
MAVDDKASHKVQPLRVAKAVFWSFFGVRRESDLDRDAATIQAWQVILGGLLGAILLVGILVAVAYFATR